MKPKTLKQRFVTAILLVIISSTIFSLSAKAGVDSYSIYLNNKLLLTQSISKPLTLQSLQLEKANPNDELIIYYTQCNAPDKIGSGRKLIVKDAEGKTLKEWKFKDVKGSDKGMVIPVKELLALQKGKEASSLAIFYNSTNAYNEQKLASL